MPKVKKYSRHELIDMAVSMLHASRCAYEDLPVSEILRMIARLLEGREKK